MTNLNKLKEKTLDIAYESITVNSVNSFPIYIFDLSFKINSDELVTKIYDFKTNYPRSMNTYLQNRTNVHAWHSDYATHKMTDIFNNLLEIKTKKLKQIYPHDVNVKVRNTWVNIYNKNDYTDRHQHSLHGMSSIYYPFISDNPTPVIFDNNNPDKFKTFEIIPKRNMLILFHSSIFHKVPNINEECRISISSNFDFEHIDTRDPFSYQD